MSQDRGDHAEQPGDDPSADAGTYPEHRGAQLANLAADTHKLGFNPVKARIDLIESAVDLIKSAVDLIEPVIEPLIGPGSAFHRL